MQRNVLDYLEWSAERNPHKTAFADEDLSVSYEEVVSNAKRFASGLKSVVGECVRRPVVVLVDRDVKSVICFFGVVYSGNFYVPINDQDIPLERIHNMIERVNPVAIVCHEKSKQCGLEIGTDVPLLEYEELIRGEAQEDYLAYVREQSLDTDPLYAMFTSGSTGGPKGVVVAHHSVIDLVDVFKEEFGFDETCVFGNQAPFDFDVSVKDIYSTIKNAATMQIVPKRLFMLPLKLVEYLNEKKINTAIWAASALVIVANFKTFEKVLPEHLRCVMFSGEVMPNKVLNYWRKHLPDVQYVNLYGPTEITCNCTFYKVDRPFDDNEVLPIGRKFANTGILLLDSERRHEVGEGETGELCVCGSSLALGYYNDPERTAEVFIQNPMNSSYPERIYCTGDLARYDANGDLLFVSRRDFQIKHMGHRIELSEVENAVNVMPFIEYAVCLYDEAHGKIVLFYQAPRDYKKEIIEGLGKTLPKYMWPNVFRQYEKLPMNKNAKVDRVKLKEAL